MLLSLLHCFKKNYGLKVVVYQFEGEEKRTNLLNKINVCEFFKCSRFLLNFY